MNMNTHKYEYSSLNIHISMNKSRGSLVVLLVPSTMVDI
jgi:hypothetical protein